MYLFYADASGTLTPKSTENDFLYVYGCVCLFERNWHTFEKTINRHKQGLLEDKGLNLCLADCEIKSNWIRIPKERAEHPFLSQLSDGELTALIDVYYEQLIVNNMYIFASVVDKRLLNKSCSRDELHRIAWEGLLEQIETFMRLRQNKQQAIVIVDDESKQTNQSLALQHFEFQDKGLSDALWLKHIAELPMFTRSELSNGIQLADLIAYNIRRALQDGNPDYEHFLKIKDYILRKPSGEITGISVHPYNSEVFEILKKMKGGPR